MFLVHVCMHAVFLVVLCNVYLNTGKVDQLVPRQVWTDQGGHTPVEVVQAVSPYSCHENGR